VIHVRSLVPLDAQNPLARARGRTAPVHRRGEIHGLCDCGAGNRLRSSGGNFARSKDPIVRNHALHVPLPGRPA